MRRLRWAGILLGKLVHELEWLGYALIFLGRVLRGGYPARRTLAVFVEQLWNVGVRPIAVMSLAGLAMGVVLAVQVCRSLVMFRAEGQLASLVAAPLLREFSPVLSAWLFSGMLGSALTAETGLMKVNQQIMSLDLMGIDPVRRIFMPRFYAVVVSLPLLMLIFSVMGLLGATWVSVKYLAVDAGVFWGGLVNDVHWLSDLRIAILKSLSFAVLIAWLSLFYGSESSSTPEGVSRATTQGVTKCLLGVLLLDLFSTVFICRR